MRAAQLDRDVGCDQRRGRRADRRRRRSGRRAPWRGHEVAPHGALNDDERDDWAWASEAAARDVAEGRADRGRVLLDRHRRLDRRQQGARSAGGAVRRRRDRRAAPAGGTTPTCWRCPCGPPARALLAEILDAWFEGGPARADDVANIRHVDEIS